MTEQVIGSLIRKRWYVLKKLGEGGFGSVYEVLDTVKSPQNFAMKTENIGCKSPVLKMEVAVLRRLQNTRHVCRFMECGRNDKFTYVVMTMVGKNLADYRRDAKNGQLSVSTSIRLSLQCIESLEDLHGIGFLHRDIKPSNFAMGRQPDTLKLVYILDFGLARQYLDADGEKRPARSAAGFRGTIRYAPVNCHLNKDLGRHDDLWSLLYMTVEFIAGKLPWRDVKGRVEVGECKKSTPLSTLLLNCPEDLRLIHEHLQGLTFQDAPDYAYLCSVMKKILEAHNVKDDDPFDWELAQQSTSGGAQKKDGTATTGQTRDRKDGTENEIPDPFDKIVV